MDFIPSNDNVSSLEQTPQNSAENHNLLLEEEATAIAIDNLVSQSPLPLNSVVQNNSPTPNNDDNLVYFSDGTMTRAEFNMINSDQPADQQKQQKQQIALPDSLIEIYRNLGLLGRILNGSSLATLRVLQAFGTIGESVIDFLGISRPKYEYEINLGKEMQRQDQARNDKIANLYSTWQADSSQIPSTSSHVPEIPPLSENELSTMPFIAPLSSANSPSETPLYNSPSSSSLSHSNQILQPDSLCQKNFTSFAAQLPTVETLSPAIIPSKTQDLLTTQSFSTTPDLPLETIPSIVENLPQTSTTASNIPISSQTKEVSSQLVSSLENLSLHTVSQEKLNE